ncbi:MAG: hypothetical protein Q8R44_00880 [Novosphingobium sp.]|nr:hypothetical protein [Novosphingobium sp.]
MPQTLRNSAHQHVSTTGCLVDDDRWKLRKGQALEMVERRLLTVREASEHFGLPVNEIAGSRH